MACIPPGHHVDVLYAAVWDARLHEACWLGDGGLEVVGSWWGSKKEVIVEFFVGDVDSQRNVEVDWYGVLLREDCVMVVVVRF